MATETDKKKSYKDTLNLPQTAFPMEAKLVAERAGAPAASGRRAAVRTDSGITRTAPSHGFCMTARRSRTATSTSGT